MRVMRMWLVRMMWMVTVRGMWMVTVWIVTVKEEGTARGKCFWMMLMLMTTLQTASRPRVQLLVAVFI